MENKTVQNVVHGFKVFRPDWTCSPNGNTKQYTCPGKFEEEGELDVCGHGMHFCQTAADCFNYYNFDSSNKVAEVIAYGEVRTDGDKSCTDKLEIVREIPWDEVLRIVNIGKNCTGRCDTGDCNTGDCNTGNTQPPKAAQPAFRPQPVSPAAPVKPSWNTEWRSTAKVADSVQPIWLQKSAVRSRYPAFRGMKYRPGYLSFGMFQKRLLLSDPSGAIP